MKQTLRHIFLLVALFVATANVWADCVIFSDNGPYEMMTGGSSSRSKEFTISNPRPCNQLKFTNTYGTAASGNVILTITYSDGTISDEIKKGKGAHTINLERKIVSKLHFKGGGALKKTLSAITLTQASYVDAPQGFTNNAWPAGTDIVGNSAQKTATIAWSDATFTWELLNNTDNQFSASFSSTGATCTYGTSNITITYLRTKPGNHSATLKITASTGATYTIALSGVTGKYIPQAAKKMDMVMNESYNPSDIFDVYYLANNVKNTISDYIVRALDPTIANYVGGKIVTNYQTGTARFQLTREADTNFDALNETISVNVNPAGGCYAIYNAGTGSDIAGSNGAVSEAFTLTGAGDVLTFKYKLNSSTGDATWMHYVTPQYSEEESGNNFDYIRDANGNVYREETKSMSYKTSSSIPIPINAKRIRFERTANGTGGRTVKISEIYVTRKQQIAPQLVSNSLSLPQATIGRPVSASFDLNWSTCSDEIVLLSTNSNFVLSKSSIDATSGRGTTTITVTYDANSGSQSGTIIIYDQSQKIEISVSCEVKAKLATEIIYTGEATYPETPDGIPYPFYVKDENGNTVQGAKIRLETSNEDILSFDATKIYPHCGGNVTLTATYADDSDNTHEPCSLSVPISVPYCQREIVWNTSYLNFATDENGYIDDKRALNATINPQSEITYQLHTVTSTPFAEIIEENGTYSLHVFGEGCGYIIAIANECLYEGQMYETTYKIKELRVSGAGACDPNSLLIWEGIENEPFVYKYSTSSSESTRIYPLTGLPAATMTFGAHAATSSVDNRLVISFSTESEGDNWIGQHRQEVVAGSSYNWNYSCPVPAEAKRVRFQSEASLTIYFNGVTIPQQTYIRPSEESLEISDAIVNVPFERTFSVDYSNVRLLQWKVSDNHDLGLKVVANQEVNNDCGLYGSYSFTLKGESPYPQENVKEIITFFTSAGDEVEIPVTITATLSKPFYFNVQDGDMAVSSNWTYNGSNTHGLLPDKRFPIIVSQAMTINEGELVAYGITIEDGGSVNIQPEGGLTLHAGGFTRVDDDENNLVIHSNTAGSGFVRVSPFFTTKVPGTMPNAKVNFTTKANMNAGDNRDAAWQYIGAPGSGASLQKEASTVLYLRSEQWGWLPYWNESVVALEPFAGYALTQKEQPDFTFQSQLINEDQTIQLTYTEEGMKGDNLWANSYMAPLDITKFSPGDFTGNVDYTFYLYNSGSWNAWNDNNNQNQSTTNDASISTPGRYYAINFAKIDATQDQTVIPPMQGVYMKAGEGGGTLTINYEKHVWNNSQTGKMNTPLRIAPHSEENQSADFLRIRLQVNSENSGADRMYVIQDSLATSGYDNGYDAPKQMATGLMNIYTNESFGKMEISSTDHMDGMFIGFQAGEDTHYIMTFTSLVGDSLYLYDLEEDKFVEMLDGEQYHFSAIAQSTNDMRFQVLVAPTLPDETPGQGGGVTTDVENITTPQLWISDRKVFVSNAKPNSTMAIYTASGMLVTAPYTLHTTPYTLDLSYLPTGVYVLRLNDQAYKFVCK